MCVACVVLFFRFFPASFCLFACCWIMNCKNYNNSSSSNNNNKKKKRKNVWTIWLRWKGAVILVGLSPPFFLIYYFQFHRRLSFCSFCLSVPFVCVLVFFPCAVSALFFFSPCCCCCCWLSVSSFSSLLVRWGLCLFQTAKNTLDTDATIQNISIEQFKIQSKVIRSPLKIKTTIPYRSFHNQGMLIATFLVNILSINFLSSQLFRWIPPQELVPH